MATPAQVGKLCSKSPICRQYFIVGPCRVYPKVQVNEIESLKENISWSVFVDSCRALVVVKFGFLQVTAVCLKSNKTALKTNFLRIVYNNR